MKLKHAALALAMIGTAFGGSVTVTNINAGSSQLVLDNAGNPVVGGFVGVGTVTDPGADFATLTGSDLATLFDAFATGATTDPGGTAVLDLAMSFEVTGSDNFNSSALAGQAIYLVLGNGPDLASSTQAGVMTLGAFPSSEPTPPNPVIMSQANASVIFGDYSGEASNGTGFVAGVRPAFQLGGLVPEPSSSLLAAFAGFVLLARRKR
jgi:hypothetical protein